MKKVILLWGIMLLSIVSLAAEDVVAKILRTETLTIEESTVDQVNEEEGWKWETTTATLTLDNIRFCYPVQSAIHATRDLTIVVKGHCEIEGSISCKKAMTLKFEEGADLSFKMGNNPLTIYSAIYSDENFSLPENTEMNGCYATLSMSSDGQSFTTGRLDVRGNDGICSLAPSSDTTIEINETNFPDETFRNYVLENFDVNKDNKLSPIETSSVAKIDLEETSAKNIAGIKYFKHLKNAELSTLELGNSWEELYEINTLQTLFAGECGITCESLDASKWPNLTTLAVSKNNIKSINFGNKPLKLEYLRVANNELTEIDLSSCEGLLTLEIGTNNINAIDLSKCKDLERLDIYQTNIAFQSEWLSGLPKLISLDVSSTPTTSLKISNMEKLAYLSASECHLTSLEISECDNLETIYAYGNKLTEVKGLDKLPKLKSLVLSENRLTHISLPEQALSFSSLTGQIALVKTTAEDPKKIDLTQLKDLKIDEIKEVKNGTLNGTIVTLEEEEEDDCAKLTLENGLTIKLVTEKFIGKGVVSINDMYSSMGMIFAQWAFFEEIWQDNDESGEKYKAEYRILEGTYESAEAAAKEKSKALTAFGEDTKSDKAELNVFTKEIEDCLNSHIMCILGLNTSKDHTLLQTRIIDGKETNYIYAIEKKAKSNIAHVEPHKPGKLNLTGCFEINDLDEEGIKTVKYALYLIKGEDLQPENIMYGETADGKSQLFHDMTDKIQPFSMKSDEVELEEDQVYSAIILTIQNNNTATMKMIKTSFVVTNATMDIAVSEPKAGDKEFKHTASVTLPEGTAAMREGMYGMYVAFLYEGKRITDATEMISTFAIADQGGITDEELVGVSYQTMSKLSEELEPSTSFTKSDYVFATGDYTLATLLVYGNIMKNTNLAPVYLTFVSVVDPSTATDIQAIERERGCKAKAMKVMRDGKILIIWGDKTYDINGARVR